ncbi:hypothetical protein SLEP1_g53842 [Rubroshorea leprosula]|uniref:Uncharacterized protein n=1 Tax=Rubroshorea leprosula TaxID=152421 RepID=A0AAV5MAI1_9ROSI|nr:hypothetical protein SLEP1_g53842 [Rubroshorea leprosula]
MPAETKQEDVPKEEEEKAQVSFEKNTYEDSFEIYFIQAKDPIKEYINCLNTSSSLKSKGALLEELGRTSAGLNPNHLKIVIGENLMVDSI